MNGFEKARFGFIASSVLVLAFFCILLIVGRMAALYQDLFGVVMCMLVSIPVVIVYLSGVFRFRAVFKKYAKQNEKEKQVS